MPVRCAGWGARGIVAAILAALAAGLPSAAAGPGGGAIPFDRLAPDVQARLREVTDHAVYSRRVLGVAFRSHALAFRYLLDHPDFAAAIGRALGVARYRVEPRGGNRFWLDDTRGVQGTFEVVYADEGRWLVHAQGIYNKRWLPTISGRIVLLLEFRHQGDAPDRARVINDLTGHLRVENPILALLARLIVPLLARETDEKMAQIFAVAGRVSERIHDDPAGVLRFLRQRPELSPGALTEFSRLIPQGG